MNTEQNQKMAERPQVALNPVFLMWLWVSLRAWFAAFGETMRIWVVATLFPFGDIFVRAVTTPNEASIWTNMMSDRATLLLCAQVLTVAVVEMIRYKQMYIFNTVNIVCAFCFMFSYGFSIAAQLHLGESQYIVKYIAGFNTTDIIAAGFCVSMSLPILGYAQLSWIRRRQHA
jgi:hypothetical protein